jgi:formylglycine-generating enzyme required for sulfatase activity
MADTPQMHISSVEKRDDAIINERDANGLRASGLLIRTNLSGLSFRSNMGVIRVSDENPGEYMVYVSAAERVLEIYCTGYEPLFIVLREEGVSLNRNGGGDVWQIAISGDAIAGSQLPVSILTEPEEAEILIDGEDRGGGPVFQLARGRHDVHISYEGYTTIDTTVEIDGDNALLRFNLERRRRASVNVSSDPSGAAVFLDEYRIGETPLSVFYDAGEYTMQIEKSGYVTKERRVSVGAGGLKESFSLEENVGFITVETIDGAQVYINGTMYESPENIQLSPQVVQIEVQHPKANTEHTQINLQRNDRKTVNIEPQIPRGTIALSVVPFEAEIVLTGDAGERFTADGSHIFEDIPVGEYTAVVRADGYQEEDLLFRVVPESYLEESVALIEGFQDMVRIPAEGETFTMSAGDGWVWSDYTQQEVTFTSDFYMSKYLITQAEYEEITGETPSRFSGAHRPVERVSWYDAARYCNARSSAEGREPVYYYEGSVVDGDTKEGNWREGNWRADFSKNGYRLPTEAEWEYAAQGGRGYEYGTDDGTLDHTKANYHKEIGETTDVGSYPANPFGLYDMAGNVWEWVNDWSGDYSVEPVTDPTGPVTGSKRVSRGGSWYVSASYCRVANRSYISPDFRYNELLGFRVLLSAQ